MENLLELVEKLQNGGRIISSGEASNVEISAAKADNRFYVDENGFGYLYFNHDNFIWAETHIEDTKPEKVLILKPQLPRLFVEDTNGNRNHYGESEKCKTKDEAKKALESLTNCQRCIDCENCIDCVECIECKDCVECRLCKFCIDCIICVNCKSCQTCRNLDLELCLNEVVVTDTISDVERKLNAPARYELPELFAELRFGRPVSEQAMLDEFIKFMESPDEDDRVMLELPFSVFPSEEKTITVHKDVEYNGAHFYEIRNCLGFKDGETQYVDSAQSIQFIQKNDDGSMIPGLQSEQLVLALYDRHVKLNNRFPSVQNEKMLEGLTMFVDACKDRVEERMGRGVMGDLKK